MKWRVVVWVLAGCGPEAPPGPSPSSPVVSTPTSPASTFTPRSPRAPQNVELPNNPYLITTHTDLGELRPPEMVVLETPDGPRLMMDASDHRFLLDLRTTQTSFTVGRKDAWWIGLPGGEAAAMPDVDGDGTDELWLSTGPVVLASGGAAGPTDVLAELDSIGDVAVVGDVDGNGHPDVVTAAPFDVALWRGPHLGARAAPDVRFLDAWEAEAVGDVDGDGVDDLILVGNPHDASAAWLVLDPPDGDHRSQDVAAGRYRGSEIEEAAHGDLDGDGSDDIVLYTRAHSAYLLHDEIGDVEVDQAAWAELIGPERATAASIAIGDYDGDGQDDYAMSGSTFVKGYEGHDLRWIWLLHGPVADGATVDLAAEGTVYVVGPYTRFADEILAADMDLDGSDELLASGVIPTGQSWGATVGQAAVWVIHSD